MPGVGPVAVSMGEPAGIGTEVLFKAYSWFKAQGPRAGVPFFVIDDPARLALIARERKAPFRVQSIERPADCEAAFAEGLPVLPIGGVEPSPLAHVKPGEPSTATAEAVMGSIRQAAGLCLSGDAAAVVTLPIQKSVLQDAGFSHPGHTEYLGALTEEAPLPKGHPRGPVMMLAAGSFRTVPVTVHLALRAVPELLRADEIVKVGLVTHAALKRDFGVAQPRIAVAGLNPHAGESGRMGSEEAEVIVPAVAALRERGVDAFGPLPADTMFHEEARGQYDAALGMYHDQALIPIKALAFHEAVNVTLGLPIVRTSPDHGTGLGIAGKNVARPDSTIAAVLTAAKMAKARAQFDA